MKKIPNRPKLTVSDGVLDSIAELLACDGELRNQFAMNPKDFLAEKGIDIGELTIHQYKYNKPSEACTLATVCVFFAGVAVVFVAGAVNAVVAATGLVAYAATTVYQQVSVYTYAGRDSYDTPDSSTNFNTFVC